MGTNGRKKEDIKTHLRSAANYWLLNLVRRNCSSKGNLPTIESSIDNVSGVLFEV